jgi:hypothetical protein
MNEALNKGKDEDGLILYTYCIASRNQDLREKQEFYKVISEIKIDKNVLPIVTSAVIEA